MREAQAGSISPREDVVAAGLDAELEGRGGAPVEIACDSFNSISSSGGGGRSPPFCGQAVADSVNVSVSIRSEAVQGQATPAVDATAAGETGREEKDGFGAAGEKTKACEAGLEREWRDLLKIKDGGGIRSTADWFCTPSIGLKNQLAAVRKDLVTMLLTNDFVARFRSRSVQKVEESEWGGQPSFFTREERGKLRGIVLGHVQSAGFDADSHVREGQPLLLNLLRGLANLTGDQDRGLVGTLEEGVPTGTEEPIPASGVWRPCPIDDANDALDYVVCDGNWKRASDKPGVVMKLMLKELERNWVEELPGGLREARQRWKQIAVGKLGLVEKVGKDPRLTGDSSIDNVNPKVRIGERTEQATVGDVKRLMDRLEPGEELEALGLDISSFHKIMLVRPDERGKSIFMAEDENGQRRYFAYKVCHFGARYSAYWGERLGALLTRLLHLWIFLPHALWRYVDDFFFVLRKSYGPVCGLLALAFFEALGVPLSLHKMQYGVQIEWIGLELRFRQFLEASLPDVKRSKILALLRHVCLSKTEVTRDMLRSLIGMLLWYCNVAVLLRPWLSELFRLLHKPRQRFKSLDEAQLRELLDACNNDLRVASECVLCDVLAGWRVMSISGVEVQRKEDIHQPKLKHGKGLIRFLDFSSTEVEVDVYSAYVARLFHNAVQSNCPWQLGGKRDGRQWASAADAYADESGAGIGGWWTADGSWPEHPGQIRWFFVRVTKKYLPAHWGFKDQLQRAIATLEAVAQWVLFALRLQEGLGSNIELRQFCDNFGVVCASQKMFSTKAPLCYALQGIAWEAARAGSSVDISHRAGTRNEFADALSRLDDPKHAMFAAALVQENRREVDLLAFLSRPWAMVPAPAREA